MSPEQIQKEFDSFFEFDSDDRSIVTSVSCRLFAEHIAKLEREATNEVLRQARAALLLMVVQFSKTPSTLKDSEARCEARAAIVAIDNQLGESK